jgi:hypothetical protein
MGGGGRQWQTAVFSNSKYLETYYLYSRTDQRDNKRQEFQIRNLQRKKISKLANNWLATKWRPHQLIQFLVRHRLLVMTKASCFMGILSQPMENLSAHLSRLFRPIRNQWVCLSRLPRPIRSQVICFNQLLKIHSGIKVLRISYHVYHQWWALKISFCIFN